MADFEPKILAFCCNWWSFFLCGGLFRWLRVGKEKTSEIKKPPLRLLINHNLASLGIGGGFIE